MQDTSVSPARLISEALDRIQLPTLSRPPVPPDAPATKELVEWGITKYAYSVIAHVRTILRGTLILVDAGLEPAAIVLCRHLYEWNMQTCFAVANFKSQLKAADLDAAWEFFLRISDGNNWVRDHGAKYTPELPTDEVEGSFRIKHSMKVYKEYRTQRFGTEKVDDDYGYLSERSHPNGFCLQPYLKIISPSDVSFIEPQSRKARGLLEACVLEWTMADIDLLALAREDAVRVLLVRVLNELVGQTT